MFSHKYFYTTHNGLIFLKISEYCNIQCSFCYQGAPDGTKMDTEEKINRTLENLDYVVEKQQAYAKRAGIKIIPTFVMFGGEPMTNKTAIYRLCDHIKKKYYGKLDYRVTITTNGTIFDEDVIRALCDAQKRPLSLMMSVDLDKGTCDTNRRFKLGGSIFDVILKNIDRYVSLLNEVNGKPGLYLQIASVAAVLGETLKKMQETIELKERSTKLKAVLGPLKLHQTGGLSEEEKDKYLKEFADFIEDKFMKKVNDLSLSKTDLLRSLERNIINLEPNVAECYGLWTINSSGHIEYCNKNNKRPDGVVDPEWMKERVFAVGEEEESFFDCTKQKLINGHKYKTAAKKRVMAEAEKRYTIRYFINEVAIDLNLDKSLYSRVNKWIRAEGGLYNSDFKIRINADAKHIIDEDLHDKINFTTDMMVAAPAIMSDGKMLMNMMMQDIYLTDFSKPFYEWMDTSVLELHRAFNKDVIQILRGNFNKDDIPILDMSKK